MTGRSAAIMAAGSAALTSSTLAFLIIWLLFTRPLEVANVANGSEVTGLLELAASTLYDMLLRLLQYL
jgi:hypothetical protein